MIFSVSLRLMILKAYVRRLPSRSKVISSVGNCYKGVGRDSNSQPLEPQSTALPIEPPTQQSVRKLNPYFLLERETT